MALSFNYECILNNLNSGESRKSAETVLQRFFIKKYKLSTLWLVLYHSEFINKLNKVSLGKVVIWSGISQEGVIFSSHKNKDEMKYLKAEQVDNLEKRMAMFLKGMYKQYISGIVLLAGTSLG